MNIYRKVLTCLLLPLYFVCAAAQAEDIDIFAGTKEVDTSVPNVIFVLDNSANWSRNAQKWPDGTQGQSEVQALKTVLAAQVGQLNVGMIEYSTGGTSGDRDGGFVRFDLQYMDQDAYDEFAGIMDTIDANINSPTEKRDQSNLYGDLPWDFYNYLAGEDQSKGGAGTPSSIADSEAYDTQWSKFESPITGPEGVCGDTYMVWIGNNRQGGNFVDNATNTAALTALYDELGIDPPFALAGDSGDPLPVPEFTTVETIEEVCGEDTEIPAGSTTSSCVKRASDACQSESDGGWCPDGVSCTCTQVSSCGRGEETYRVSWPLTEVEGSCEDVVTTTVEATGDFDDSTGLQYNFDDWSKFLYDHGVPVSVTVEEEDEDGDPIDVTYNQRIKVTTYAIDVFNAQQQADLSSVWFSAAYNGNGRYFQARSRSALEEALTITLSEILSVSSAFSAVTMPLSTNNSARFANEIYVGMFRPSPGAEPRWYGNLKLYELAKFTGDIALADRNKRRAINALTGFARDCAETWWSYDSGDYWANLGVDPSMASACQDAIDDGVEWSDLPDGPFVEKGGVGQVTRLDPASLGRMLYTVDAGALVEIDDGDATAMGGDAVLDYVRGIAPGVGETMPDDGLRSTAHGGVVHSRPIAIRYDDGRIVVYYGADDGVFRAVDAAGGQELWGLIAPEHFPLLERLYNNSPLIDFEGAVQDEDLSYAPKDYFFDGGTGTYITYAAPDDPDSSALGALETAYIFPIMRRGGRMVYALDVKDPDEPELLWRQGCPNLDNNTGCTTGFTNLGQTWSKPIGIKVKGYPDADSDPEPLVIMGGGFDDCLNEDQAAYPTSCSSANGKGVYVLDAESGTLVTTFDTEAPVIGDLAPVDMNSDGLTDFVYLADVKGNIYRIRYANLVQNLDGLVDVPDGAIVPIDETGDWVIEKIGETSGNEQRFFNSVSVTLFQNYIYVVIGSGDRERPLEVNYPYDDSVQNYLYVLFDTPYFDYVEELEAGDNNETYTRRVVSLSGSDMYQVGTAFPDNTAITDYEGFYWPLSDRGEQVTSPAAIGGGQVLFSTLQPGGVSNGLCAEPLGLGKAYAIDLFNPDVPESETCAGGGYCLPDTIFPVTGVFDGCEDGEDCGCPENDPDCNSCAEDEPNCRDTPYCEQDPVPEDCSDEFGCIRGGFNFCDLDPSPDPTRGRTFFTENIDRE